MRKEWIGRSMAFGVALGGLVAAADPAGATWSTHNQKQVDGVTCEEFLALDPENQQRIAYWIDGYRVAKSETTVGQVAFDKFDQPIGMLVEDCKTTPKETLWEKVKKHL